MITTTLVQPESQLGLIFADLLASERRYSRIVFVSAFTALRTILRLREGVLAAAEAGAVVRLTLGIDLGGTSRDVLEELLSWNCEVWVYHNPISRATFHPKLYLFECESDSTLFLGSNNLTDGGLFTNYEAASQCSFTFPADADEYTRILRPLQVFLDPSGPTVRRLDGQLIETLSALGILLTEVEARRNRRPSHEHAPAVGEARPPNPFVPVSVPRPPLLQRNIRELEPQSLEAPPEEVSPPLGLRRPEGVLLWKKTLPRTDALQVRPGSHHTMSEGFA